MAHKINTVSARDALKPRHAPYWHQVRRGCYLGFRKTSDNSAGAWLARFRNGETGKQPIHSLGRFEKIVPSDRFEAAMREAEAWFKHMGSGGSGEVITLADACRDYVTDLRQRKGDSSADATAASFKRIVYSNEKLSSTPLLKLTSKMLRDWRTAIANTKLIPQDKTKAAVKPRADSTLNREMSILRAALNLALDNGHVTTDAAWRTALRPIKNADRRREGYLDLKQRREFIDKAAPDIAAFLHGLSLLPLRPGALAGLKAGDYNKRLRVLKVGVDKQGKDRKIKLPKATAELFAEASKDKLPGAPLLSRADGKAWDKDAWKGPVKAAAEAAKLPAGTTAYTLRHSVISDLVHDGLDLLTTAQVSGTSVAMIERHYGHLRSDVASDALAKLAL